MMEKICAKAAVATSRAARKSSGRRYRYDSLANQNEPNRLPSTITATRATIGNATATTKISL